MTYILDTNAITALMKGHAAVVERLAAVSKAEVMLPQPALAEIAYGIARLPRSKRRTWLQGRFDLVRSEMGRAADRALTTRIPGVIVEDWSRE